MKRSLLLALVVAALAVPSLAQQRPEEPAAHQPGSDASASELTDGEIRKVDKGAARITIRHAEIRNLDMPPMTMVFQVRDAALLDRFKAGDRIRFAAENSASGIVVTELELAP